jgi:hypothetical protein
MKEKTVPESSVWRTASKGPKTGRKTDLELFQRI